MNGKFLARLRKTLLLLAVLPALPASGLPGSASYQFTASAFAEEDDDDDDEYDDDDDDDDDYRAPVIRREPAPAPEPSFAANQIIAIGLSDENLATLTADGYSVLEQTDLAIIGQSIVKLEIPAGTNLEAAREDVRALDPAAQADFNHYYLPGQAHELPDACAGGACWAPTMIRWPGHDAGSPAACDAPVRIGMIDTGINPDHDTFAESTIEIMRIGSEQEPASGHQHGTAVAALFVGSWESRTPGLLPNAQLFAVDAFERAGSGRDRAEVFDLVIGIDHLLAQDVSVINMSLAGDANDLLERSVESAIADHQAFLVAAVGNDGPHAEPLYPAAYPEVIAVTAVDRNKRPYRRAVQGEHVDFASPGVDIWAAASISGARPKTGTSFAAPFVSAAAAMLKAANPTLTHHEIEQHLASAAQDLGEPGKDPTYGWGLLNASTACAPSERQRAPSVAD